MKLTQIIHCEKNITYGATENSQYDYVHTQCNCIHNILFCKRKEGNLHRDNWTAYHVVACSDESSSVLKSFNGQSQKRSKCTAGMYIVHWGATYKLNLSFMSFWLDWFHVEQPFFVQMMHGEKTNKDKMAGSLYLITSCSVCLLTDANIRTVFLAYNTH